MMDLEKNIRRQCKIYIDALLAGVEGDQIRFHAHRAFCLGLVRESDEDTLTTILHNLDQVIGFTVESVGKKLPEKPRQAWADALFDKIWDLYTCSDYWMKEGDEGVSG